ncbi:MAG TPA: hypothetical protein VHZ73_03450 [Vicinamibacterales bacterium]|nr:hypothetical protein [Vicinamibacterales bacterium]
MQGFSPAEYYVLVSEEDKWVSGKPIAVVLAVLFIGAGLIKWWPSDTRALRRQLDAVADVVSMPPTESDISRAARLADLRSYFAPDVHIRLTEVDIPNRDALLAVVQRLTVPSSGVYVEFLDEKFTIPGDDTGHVELTARVSKKDPSSGDTDVDDRPVSFDFVKVNGDWVIKDVVSLVSPAAQ